MALREQVEVVRAGEDRGDACEGKVEVVEGDPGRGRGVVKRVRYQKVVKGIG